MAKLRLADDIPCRCRDSCCHDDKIELGVRGLAPRGMRNEDVTEGPDDRTCTTMKLVKNDTCGKCDNLLLQSGRTRRTRCEQPWADKWLNCRYSNKRALCKKVRTYLIKRGHEFPAAERQDTDLVGVVLPGDQHDEEQQLLAPGGSEANMAEVAVGVRRV